MINIYKTYLNIELINPALPPGPQPQEDGSYELAEAGGVDRVLFALVAVLEVVGVQGGAGQRHTRSCLVVGCRGGGTFLALFQCIIQYFT